MGDLMPEVVFELGRCAVGVLLGLVAAAGVMRRHPDVARGELEWDELKSRRIKGFLVVWLIISVLWITAGGFVHLLRISGDAGLLGAAIGVNVVLSPRWRRADEAGRPPDE